MIEMLVVMSIILLLFGLSFTVMSASMENARVEATRATIRQLDSALQERIEDFNRVNLRPQAEQFRSQYNNGTPTNTPSTITHELAEVIVRKDRFRGAFPQRLEDLFGIDGLPGGGDDSPLWAVWKRKMNANGIATTNAAIRPAGHLVENENVELLYLALTEGAVFGSPALSRDRINARHLRETLVVDTNSDGIPDKGNGIPEIIDEWGQVLRFYNWPTRLIRPAGGTVDPAAFGNGNIVPSDFVRSAVVLIPDAPGVAVGAPPLASTTFSHPLNQDPDDVIGILGAAQTSAQPAFRTSYNRVPPFRPGQPLDENLYHTVDTYWISLIVSGGPDQKTGLFEPNGSNPLNTGAPIDPTKRLGLPIALDPAAPNAALLDLLYDDITNRQP